MTFGQPFRRGDIPKGDSVAAYLDGKALPIQVNAKATNPDGSLRHAVVTVELPKLSGHASQKLSLRAVPAPTASAPTITLQDVLASKFDADVTLTIDGTPWHLDARDLLQRVAQQDSCKAFGKACSQWLSGPLVSEWVVGGPLLDAAGNPQKHLAAYFAVRAYGPAPVKRVRVDVVVENDWAYVPDPHNITYNAKVQVGGKTVYSLDNLTQYRQSRWHKHFWWGAPDPVYARLDSRYLQYSLAVPRYEDVPAPAALLAKVPQECAPMQHCDQTQAMGDTGAQAAIGPLPRWTSAYVIDPTYRAFRWMLADNDALGAYSMHYRDAATGLPLSIVAHPCATTVIPAEVPRCPVAPHGDDRFPRCPKTAECKTPLSVDEGHHPSPAYVAYLVTGDWYYLTELTEWSTWVSLWQNPAYRHYTDGLLSHDEQRGQGWGLRTVGYAAYILPDDDPFKKEFHHVVASNLRWYNQQYTDNPAANKLGIITNGYTVAYPNHGQVWTGFPTWQNSFFVWAVGNLKDLGFPGAGKLLDWVSRFPVQSMTSPDFCWTMASAYELQIRDTRTSPIYDSLGEVYAKTFPQFNGVACNSSAMWARMNKGAANYYTKDVMFGYPQSPTGFVANFQAGLAAAVGSDVPNADRAWARFMSRHLKPDYATAPQFAVIPRGDEAVAPAH
ncbi:MAG TPA: hypothetical protein VF292_09600 [Rhodanobacteraceae bacterium]